MSNSLLRQVSHTLEGCAGSIDDAVPMSSASQTTPYNNGFPHKLHKMLENSEADGTEHIFSWLPDGQAFRIHNRNLFISKILPKYYHNINVRSFLRQLNLYGFVRETNKASVNEYGSYRHPCFRRSDPSLCSTMQRKVKSRSMKHIGNVNAPTSEHMPGYFFIHNPVCHRDDASRDTLPLQSDEIHSCDERNATPNVIEPEEINMLFRSDLDLVYLEESAEMAASSKASSCPTSTLSQLCHRYQFGSSSVSHQPHEEEMQRFKRALAMFLPEDEAVRLLRKSPHELLESDESDRIQDILTELEPVPVVANHQGQDDQAALAARNGGEGDHAIYAI